LTGIHFGGNALEFWNFAGQNLAKATFYNSTLGSANFTAADTRGAASLDLSGATTTNLIWPDGHIIDLDLSAGALLVVRDWEIEETTSTIPITVDQHFAMGPGGTLQMVFEADAWDSTISFAPGIPVTLGGTLELTFAADVNLASQLGRTIDLFDWTGVTPTGVFTVSSPYQWNLSNLYTTGEVTLAAIPEPASVTLTALVLLGLAVHVRRPLPN
jgi:uncharacterized protein YjbI with pentapeptide repeats